ncbi:MAG: hypothetical protein ACOYT8_01115 [Candidatus Dependentiae bacterium]
MKKLLLIALSLVSLQVIADDIIKKPTLALSRSAELEAAERGIELIENNDLVSLERMLAGGYSANLKDERGLSLAEVAVINGNIPALQLLKRYGADFTGLLGYAIKLNDVFKDEQTQKAIDYLKQTGWSVVD